MRRVGRRSPNMGGRAPGPLPVLLPTDNQARAVSLGLRTSGYIDENTLAGAVVRRGDHGRPDRGQLGRDGDGALPLSRVIADPLAVMDVTDPVLQQDECLRAVIHAQTVAGTQVLVDPHPEIRHHPPFESVAPAYRLVAPSESDREVLHEPVPGCRAGGGE